MGDRCVRRPALSVAPEASAELASPTTSSEEKLKAYSFVLGPTWAKRLLIVASADTMSGLVRRGLANSAANQMASKLRTGLDGAWRAAGSQVDAESSGWRPFVAEKGLINEA